MANGTKIDFENASGRSVESVTSHCQMPFKFVQLSRTSPGRGYSVQALSAVTCFPHRVIMTSLLESDGVLSDWALSDWAIADADSTQVLIRTQHRATYFSKVI